MSYDGLDDSADGDPQGTPSLVARLEDELRAALRHLPGVDRAGFISSELQEVYDALRSVLNKDLHRGTVFCEWGCGLGAVCALAASLGLEAHGIEIQPELVEASRGLLETLGLEASIVQGSFLQPGDEDLLTDRVKTCTETSDAAYRELGLSLAGCDIVFSYPWPGEEVLHDRVFLRHAGPGALLLTYAEFAGVLVQRRGDDGEDELQTLGWMGRATG